MNPNCAQTEISTETATTAGSANATLSLLERCYFRICCCYKPVDASLSLELLEIFFLHCNYKPMNAALSAGAAGSQCTAGAAMQHHLKQQQQNL